MRPRLGVFPCVSGHANGVACFACSNEATRTRGAHLKSPLGAAQEIVGPDVRLRNYVRFLDNKLIFNLIPVALRELTVHFQVPGTPSRGAPRRAHLPGALQDPRRLVDVGRVL